MGKKAKFRVEAAGNGLTYQWQYKKGSGEWTDYAIATADTVVPTDFFGIVSGNNDPKKFEKSGLRARKSEFVDAPVIEEYKMVLECKLFEKFAIKEDVRVVGEIVNVSVDDSVLTDGKIDAAKLQPLAWNPISHEYVKLGESVGLAWNVGKALMNN